MVRRDPRCHTTPYQLLFPGPYGMAPDFLFPHRSQKTTKPAPGLNRCIHARQKVMIRYPRARKYEDCELDEAVPFCRDCIRLAIVFLRKINGKTPSYPACHTGRGGQKAVRDRIKTTARSRQIQPSRRNTAHHPSHGHFP